MANINTLTIDEKIGQMLCFAFHGTEYNHQLKTLIEDYHIGNIIHFSRNIENPAQVKRLNEDMQKKAKKPLFISLDHEGGMVRRVMDDIHYLPGAMALSASNEDITIDVYQTNIGLKKLGFNVNHAPVADINNNPFNPVINSRSYSDDPDIVSKLVIQAYKGMQMANVLPTVKHFPGHGDTNVDSHLGLPIVEKSIIELNRMEIKPFKEAIAKGIDGVMISHILYPSLDDKFPASLSYNIITKLLKKELGFKGLVITDSLTMAAIWRKYSIDEIVLNAVNAGNDIIMFCGTADIDMQKNIITSFRTLVDNGKIPLSRVNESVQKILSLKAKYQFLPKEDKKDINKTNINLVNNSITKAFDDNQLIPLRKNDRVLILFPKIGLASLVDNQKELPITLGMFLDYDEVIYDENTLLKNIVQNRHKYDKIILGTYNIKSDDFSVRLSEVLDMKKTIVISLRSPYDLYHLKNVQSYICTFDVTKESLFALSQKLINGEFSGKLPIQLRR